MTTVKCHDCGYVWDYHGALQRATCPSCSTKTPANDKAHADSDEVETWGEPLTAQRRHIFKAARSLCGKWLYGGATQEVEDGEEAHVGRSGDTCTRCVEASQRAHGVRESEGAR